jgi:ribosome maturation factor RimP
MVQDFRKHIEDYLAGTKYGLVDLIVRGEKKNKVIEVFIDDKENISIDDIAQVSRGLNELFDTLGLSGELSKIVVSSPGADKPFKYPWQLHKHKNRMLNITLGSGEEITGRLIDTDEEGNLAVQPVSKEKNKKAKEEAEALKISFGDIKECKVKLQF